jgi:hypothetical protein
VGECGAHLQDTCDGITGVWPQHQPLGQSFGPNRLQDLLERTSVS